jgi:hypothetical protein
LGHVHEEKNGVLGDPDRVRRVEVQGRCSKKSSSKNRAVEYQKRKEENNIVGITIKEKKRNNNNLSPIYIFVVKKNKIQYCEKICSHQASSSLWATAAATSSAHRSAVIFLASSIWCSPTFCSGQMLWPGNAALDSTGLWKEMTICIKPCIAIKPYSCNQSRPRQRRQ